MGIVIGILIIFLWISHLAYSLFFVQVSVANPALYLHMLVQTFLYTGLFITGHDAMHTSVSSNRRINRLIGTIAVRLFAGLSFKQLSKNHFKHHRNPAQEKDPDYCTSSQNFLVWWPTFLWRYLTINQLIIMAVTFNVLLIWFTEVTLITLWIIPAVLSTLQLFYFGTYKPHRKPHLPYMEPYRARTQKKNHLWAFISCYFFGYHYEHHQAPRIPWWKLYTVKNS